MGLAPVVTTDLVSGSEAVHPVDNGVGYDFYGATSGYTGLQPRAVESNLRWFLPPVDGPANMPFVTDGSLGMVVGTAGGVRGAIGLATTDAVTFDSITANSFNILGGATIITTEITIHDPLIKLASDNASDIIDTGFYAKYVNGGVKYTGFVRDATDGKYKLFDGLTVEPTTTVDTAGAGYNLGLITANIEGVKAAFGAGAVINNGSLLFGSNYGLTLLSQDTFTNLSSTKVNTWIEVSSDPVANSSAGSYALIASNYVKAGNNKNISRLYGGWFEAIHYGTGTVSDSYGAYFYNEVASGATATKSYGYKVECFGGGGDIYGSLMTIVRSNSYGTGVSGNTYGMFFNVLNTQAISSGTDNTYGCYARVDRTSATGGTLRTYGYYSDILVDNAGAGTHYSYDYYADARDGSSDADYFLWFNSPGVYRIKTDGIMAYYNPAFAPAYTPNAVDFERVVQQWVGNVLQYGVEVGGTGTLRAMQLLGSSVTATAIGVGGTPLTELTVFSTVATSPRGILSSQISTDINSARVGFAKARGVAGALTTVVTGDTIGRLMFRGYDGANYLEMASIEAGVSDTVAATRVPTYLAFSTATNAAPSVLTEWMRITSTGSIGIGTGSPSGIFEIRKNQNSDTALNITNSTNGTSALAAIYVSNGTKGLSISYRSAAYTDDATLADHGVIRTDSSVAGLKFRTGGTGKPIYFGILSTDILTINTVTQNVLIDQSVTTLVGLSIAGKASSSAALLRLNMGATPSGNVFEINATATGSGGDVSKITVAGVLTIPSILTASVSNGATGIKVGLATTDKVGFYGVSVVVQPAHANQAAITDSSGGTAGFTLPAISAGYVQAEVRDSIATLARQIAQIRTDLVSVGLWKGAA